MTHPFTDNEIAALIAKLEAATGPDRELDYLILSHADRQFFERCDRSYRETLNRALENGLSERDSACRQSGFAPCPRYTASIDLGVIARGAA